MGRDRNRLQGGPHHAGQGAPRPRRGRVRNTLAALVLTLALAALVVWAAPVAWCRWMARPAVTPNDVTAASGRSMPRGSVPVPEDPAVAKARRIVAGMSLEERVGQLVMAPLFAGDDPSVLRTAIAQRHVGSVLVIGNWRSGVAGVRRATDALQSYAPPSDRLIMATDQEGGQVQHLQGPGFDTMPSAVEQGAMPADALRRSAAAWGAQLAAAGINVDLAPVVGTVTIDRQANAPIGALDRDFGLDAAGNAAHGTAFVQGMRDAGVQSSIKHYPGLGAVSGNTDFTTDGILDMTTTADGPEAGAFRTVIDQAKPVMVMMSLATYERIDPGAPAAFSRSVLDGMLRRGDGFDGVVTSDSLSAEAVGDVPADRLGVRFVDAGGDLACVGQSADLIPILDGLAAEASRDPAFAAKVARSAERVVTLKARMGLV